jgi:hypothetical protein
VTTGLRAWPAPWDPRHIQLYPSRVAIFRSIDMAPKSLKPRPYRLSGLDLQRATCQWQSVAPPPPLCEGPSRPNQEPSRSKKAKKSRGNGTDARGKPRTRMPDLGWSFKTVGGSFNLYGSEGPLAERRFVVMLLSDPALFQRWLIREGCSEATLERADRLVDIYRKLTCAPPQAPWRTLDDLWDLEVEIRSRGWD